MLVRSLSAHRRTPIARRRTILLLLAFLLSANAAGAFVTFESGPVRPLTLSPNGSKLFATNTPDNRLEIFSVTPGGLVHAG